MLCIWVHHGAIREGDGAIAGLLGYYWGCHHQGGKQGQHAVGVSLGWFCLSDGCACCGGAHDCVTAAAEAAAAPDGLTHLALALGLAAEQAQPAAAAAALEAAGLSDVSQDLAVRWLTLQWHPALQAFAAYVTDAVAAHQI